MAGTAARRTARTSATFRCTECGWQAVKWVGRCGECQAWGSVSEVGAVTVRTTAASAVERPAVPIGEVDARRAVARPTGVPEFDRVLGGGIVPGAVVLVAGEPGIGKSTLLLDVAARAARSGEHGERRVLYVSGEESAAQVRTRAERIEAMARTLYLASETDLGDRARPDRRRSSPSWSSSTRCRRSAAPRSRGRPATSARSARSPPRSSRWPRRAASRCCSSATSPRTGRSPARACSSTSSTSSCSSRATGTRGCGWCARSRTGTAPPTRSAASTCPTSASSGSPTPAGSSCPVAPPRSPARASPSRSRAGGRWSPRCRPWSRSRPWPRRAAPPPGSTPPGSR